MPSRRHATAIDLQMARRPWTAATIAAGALACAFVASPTRADSRTPLCIACSGPDAVYHCVIGSEGAPLADDATRLRCVTEIARAGGHQSCSVRRGSQAACSETARAFVLTAPQQTLAPTPAPQARPAPPLPGPPRDPAAPPADAAARKQPPATVEELARQSGKTLGKSVERQLDNTGKTVGSAVKKTWDCVASFFSKCQ